MHVCRGLWESVIGVLEQFRSSASMKAQFSVKKNQQ